MRDKFVFSLISAVGIFCLGAGVSVWHGFAGLMSAEPVEHIAWSAAGAMVPTNVQSRRVRWHLVFTWARFCEGPFSRALICCQKPTALKAGKIAYFQHIDNIQLSQWSPLC